MAGKSLNSCLEVVSQVKSPQTEHSGYTAADQRGNFTLFFPPLCIFYILSKNFGHENIQIKNIVLINYLFSSKAGCRVFHTLKLTLYKTFHIKF